MSSGVMYKVLEAYTLMIHGRCIKVIVKKDRGVVAGLQKVPMDREYCTKTINLSGTVTCDLPDEILVSSNYYIRKF